MAAITAAILTWRWRATDHLAQSLYGGTYTLFTGASGTLRHQGAAFDIDDLSGHGGRHQRKDPRALLRDHRKPGMNVRTFGRCAIWPTVTACR
jgi:hypothetical protein